MNTVEEIVALVNAHKVHQIRSGNKHRFIEISIVTTGGRFFVRQYKFNKNSWYQAFLNEPNGQIKIGETIINIKGEVPRDLDAVNPLVNKAFWRKYGIIYGLMKLGFNNKKHQASTLELIPQ